MPIKVKCSCGRSIAAPEKLAGKRVKCPQCGNPLAIPQPPSEDSAVAQLLEEAGLGSLAHQGRSCPECGAALREEAVICVQCGYNEKLGRRMQTRVLVGELQGKEQRESLGHASLDDAVMKMEEDQEQQARLEAGMPWWGYLIILLSIIVGGAIMGNVSDAQKWKVLACVGGLAVGLVIVFFVIRLNVVQRLLKR